MARKGQQFTWDSFPARKDAEGYHCRKCGVVLTGRKTAWCGKECLKEVRLLVDWNYIRSRILRRDKWKCQVCGGRATDVDHIIELADGGSFHDWGNLRAICVIPCHREKTAHSRKERAAKKKHEA